MPKSLLDNGAVLITGATSGIGRELSRKLSTRAKSLILVAEKRERLEELANELRSKNQNLDVIVETYDINKPEEIDRMVDSILRRTNVDVLINNCAMGSIALFEKSEWYQDFHMINQDIIGLTKLTHRLLPHMVERKKGGIINVASGSAFISIPGAAVYNGVKHYVHGFTESLIMELAGTGVSVTEVCPGPVKTEMEAKSNGYNLLKISPEKAAYDIIRGFEKKQDLVYPGFIYGWTMYFASFVPTFALRTLGKGASYLARQREAPRLENKKE